MAHRRCIGLLTIHTVVYVEATCSPARTHAQYTFLLSNTQPLSRCGIILMPDGNICRPKRAEVELVQISSVGNAAAGQNTATLTGPLLFRDMFFHSRRWSWCRNPIFLLTFTSRCPKCNKSDFYPVSGHPGSDSANNNIIIIILAQAEGKMSIYPRAAAKCVTGLSVILCKHFTVLLYHATAGVGTGKQFGSSLASSKPQTSDRPFKTKAS